MYASLEMPYTPTTGSDCEVVIPLYEQLGMEKMCSLLRGMFGMVMFDKSKNEYFAFRDHLGKIPLYMGYAADGSTWVSSEMKALSNHCVRFEKFPPGHFYSSKTKSFTLWYKPMWRTVDIPTNPYNPAVLRKALEKAVERRMMSDVPWGILLSGGLDSSLVASIATRIAKQKGDTARLHSFCVGLEDSPDLKAAKKVADLLGTIHHPFTYTIQEGLDVISDVIYHLETFDTTTVRASTPMFLMARKVKAFGIKMVLSGEGADEIFGGYLYFHKCPNKAEMQAELRDKLGMLHNYDCLRANKSTAAWGVELRTPFLDADFVGEAMMIDPEQKMIKKWLNEKKTRIEKHILRSAFDTPDDPYLPDEVLWRQKEQFSDGVGYGWIDALRDMSEERVSDVMFKNRFHRFPINPPLTKEAYMYRAIFEEHFPQESAIATVPEGPSIACSTARAMAWDESFKNRADCSGRSVAGVRLHALTPYLITSRARSALPLHFFFNALFTLSFLPHLPLLPKTPGACRCL